MVPGSTLSLAVSGLIRDVYSQLIDFDFLRRTSDLAEYTPHESDSALKLLDNHRRKEIELRRRRLLRDEATRKGPTKKGAFRKVC